MPAHLRFIAGLTCQNQTTSQPQKQQKMPKGLQKCPNNLRGPQFIKLMIGNEFI